MTNILLKRGTSNAISNYIGKAGEIVLDSSTNHIIIQDGSTKGGIKVANVDDVSNLSSKSYIVETYQSGSSWYRIYSDGFKEQGGMYTTNSSSSSSVTITLLKEMTSTNYYVNLVRGIVGEETRYFGANDYNMVWNLTKKSFMMHVEGTSMSKPLGSAKWIVMGY